MQTQSIYIHFPYCETKCHYCDFFSLPEDQNSLESRKNVYSALVRELDFYQLGPINTVFMGGGTPSLVPAEFLSSIAQKLQLTAQNNLEWTIEANPSSITLEKAKMWINLGINRVSMGVQALDDDRLKWLGRVHNKNSAYQALNALFDAGFKNVSIDYILGVPGQSLKSIESELNQILTSFPDIQHLSAYLLTLKTSNSKYRELLDEESQLSHLRFAKIYLESKGFEHYEISNFCKPGKRAAHNENYWIGGAYLGIGPSAHSYWPLKNKRTKNWASLGKYVELINAQTPPVEWEETLNLEQSRMEYMMTRLRRSEGIPIRDYNDRFQTDLLKQRKQVLDSLVKKGHCEVDQYIRLKNDGFFLSDQVLGMLI